MGDAITIEVNGQKQVTAMLNNFQRALPANVKRGMRAAGVILVRDMKRKVSGPGRKQRRTPAPAFSRLTRFPGVVSGRLRNSIRFALRNSGKGLIVGPRVKYDKFLEFGTRKMPAYAFVGPTFEDKGEKAIAAINSAIMRPLK